MARGPFRVSGRRGIEDLFGGQGVQPRVYFNFTPTRTRVDNIKRMRAVMLQNLNENAQIAADEFLDAMRGFVSWDFHEDRHPSEHWPSSQTAYENMFATASQDGDKFRIVAGHGDETISENNGNVYTYGGILESGYVGEEHRVILHAYEGAYGEESFKERFVSLMTGGLLVGYHANNGN